MRFGFSSNLLQPKPSARPLRSTKAGGRREALYISAEIASSIAPACRRPGLGTRRRRTAVRLPFPRDRAIGRYEGEQLDAQTRCPGAQIAQMPRQMGWIPQDSAPMRHSLADSEGVPAWDRNSCCAPHHGRKCESLTRAWYAGDSRRFPEGRSRWLNFVWREAEAGELKSGGAHLADR